MNYYISDLHLFHTQVLRNGRFKERPFETLDEMHNEIMIRWNSKVNNGDHVYLLGDISMRGNDNYLIVFLSQLKGNIHLITGNHDRVNDARLKRQFSEIVPYKELQDSVKGRSYSLVLCHYPIFAWNGQARGSIHLYGHTHDNFDDELYQKAISELDSAYKKRDGEHHVPIRAYNVGCMHCNYEPVTLKEILEKKS